MKEMPKQLKIALVLFYLLVFSVVAYSQCSEELTTTMAAGNANPGAMFDVTAINTITIQSFESSIAQTLTEYIEIYYKTGSHIGYETNASAWTLAVSMHGGSITWAWPVEISIPNITIPAGQTYAFYITVASNLLPYLHYTVGSASTQDANLIVPAGTGNAYPFSPTNYYPRRWNGKINYTIDCDSVLRVGPVHHIEVNEGWNMVSSYLIPQPIAMEDILAPHLNWIDLVKNNSGQAYLPDFGINTIGIWNVHEGYKIKANSDFTIVMTGDTIPTAQLNLDEGWNIMPVWSTVPVDPVPLFGPELIIIKNISGQSYLPNFGINTIGDLIPSQGYKVKMSSAGSVNFN